MATDVTLSHTIDDDITFERVRHMPKRTQFVSTHRQLSWQHEKQLKQQERDHKITHSEMSRARTAMADKLKGLQDVKKQMERQKSDPGAEGRRNSAPSLEDTEDVAKGEAIAENKKSNSSLKHSHSTPSMKSLQTLSPRQPSSLTAVTFKQPLSSPTMKHSHSASAFPVSSTAIPEDFVDIVANKPGAGKGFRKTRMMSWADTRDCRVGQTGSPDAAATARPQDEGDDSKPNGRAGRRATIAEGARETSNLPPHLQQRLAEFMNSTEAFLLCPPSGAKGEEDNRSKQDKFRPTPQFYQTQEDESPETESSEQVELSVSD